MPVDRKEKKRKKKKAQSSIRHLTFLSTQVSLKLNLLIKYFKQLHRPILTTNLKPTTIVESNTFYWLRVQRRTSVTSIKRRLER